MSDVLAVINALASAIHGGALLTFALLLTFRRAIPHVSTIDVVRVYRAFGSGLGLSLGALVPTELYRHIVLHNPGLPLPSALALHWDTPSDTAWSLRVVLLFVLWVSNIHLEVWTVEPARRLDKEGQVTDLAAYEAAAGAIARQVSFNALIFAGMIAAGTLAVAWD